VRISSESFSPVVSNDLPECLSKTAWTDSGLAMGFNTSVEGFLEFSSTLFGVWTTVDE